jgi:hypothetical protein
MHRKTLNDFAEPSISDCVNYGYYYSSTQNDCHYDGFLAYGRWIIIVGAITIAVLAYVSFS